LTQKDRKRQCLSDKFRPSALAETNVNRFWGFWLLDSEEEGNCLIRWRFLLDPKKQENPVIADWVRGSGGSSEGLLGGRLAQRQAALRGKKAAGHGQLFGLFRACRLHPQHFACQKKKFSGNED